MNQEEMSKKMGKVIAKAWSDADFKARLLANPAETLQAEGFAIPEGVKINAVENTTDQFYFVIPQKVDELSEEDLDGISGGQQCTLCCCSCGTCRFS